MNTTKINHSFVKWPHDQFSCNLHRFTVIVLLVVYNNYKIFYILLCSPPLP